MDIKPSLPCYVFCQIPDCGQVYMVMVMVMGADAMKMRHSASDSLDSTRKIRTVFSTMMPRTDQPRFWRGKEASSLRGRGRLEGSSMTSTSTRSATQLPSFISSPKLSHQAINKVW